MISEYIAFRYPSAISWQRVRLGIYEPETPLGELTASEIRAIGVWRRWADAVVISPRELIVIEGAIRPELGDISKLEGYLRLVPLTPELHPYLPRIIVGELVYAIEDPLVVAMARERGLRPVQFKPLWLDEYLKVLFPRERRAPKTGGLL